MLEMLNYEDRKFCETNISYEHALDNNKFKGRMYQC